MDRFNLGILWKSEVQSIPLIKLNKHKLKFKEFPMLSLDFSKLTKDINYTHIVDKNFKEKLKTYIDIFFKENKNRQLTNRDLFLRKNLELIYFNTKVFKNDEDTTLLERVYYIVNDLYPYELICPLCGNKKRFNRFSKGYTKGCSHSHSTSLGTYLKDKEWIQKRKNTIYNKSDEEKQKTIYKMVNTIKSKYGYDYYYNISIKALESFRNDPIKHKIANQKRLNTISIKHPNNIIQKKTANTLKNKKIEYKGRIVNHYEYQHLKKLDDIDKDGLNFYQRLKIIFNRKDEHGKRIIDYTRQKMIQKGLWVDIDKLEDLEQYRRKVWAYTRKQDIKSLDNYDKRGTASNNGYHLDHIYSISQGFKNNIPIYIIGNINNLRFIPAKDNISKNNNCDIHIDELLSKIL